MAARACLAVSALWIGCGGPLGAPDSGRPDAGVERDGGQDAGPICTGSWWPVALPDPEIEAIAPLTIAGSGAPSAQVRLRHRMLRAGDGPEISLRDVPRDRSVLLYVPRVFRDAARSCASYWEPLGGELVLARLDGQCEGRARYLGELLASDKIGVSLSRAEQDGLIEVTRVRGGRVAIERVRGGLDLARELARRDDVIGIERFMPPLETTDHQRAAIDADVLQGFGFAGSLPRYSGLTGSGIRAAVIDTGVVPEHPDLQHYDASGAATGTRVISMSGGFGDDGGWHATLVAGILGGNGWSSDGTNVSGERGSPFRWRGVAPEVESFYSIVTSIDPAPWTTAFESPPAHVANCSHTQSNGFYSTSSRSWDYIGYRGALHGDPARPRRPVVFAQGNNGAIRSHPMIQVLGYYGATAPGKNPIVVGGSNANDGSHAAGAALGPTLDGRFKPDLVAGGYVDWRPLDGVLVALEEVRLVAAEGSGASDIVWTPASSDGWTLGPELATLTPTAGRLEWRTLGDGATLRFTPPAPLDGASYSALSMRYEILEIGDPTHHRAPDTLGVLWDADGDGGDDHAAWERYSAGTGVQTHTYSLPGYFMGMVHAFEVRPLLTQNTTVVLNRGMGYTTVPGGGTSLSTPLTSGVIALLLAQLRDRQGVDLELAPPLPSTIKAILIHTATDMIRLTPPARDPVNPDTGQALVYHRGPDWPTGYGLLDAARASALVDTHSASSRRWIEQPIEDGEVHTYRVPVASAGRFVATLVWDDFPGSTALDARERRLVNDLDLIAISPSGVAHGPWTLARPPLNADPLNDGIDPILPSDIVPAEQCESAQYWQGDSTLACEDHLNNVEQIEVDAPEPGVWTIRVRGDVLEPAQDYTLVVSQACASQ